MNTHRLRPRRSAAILKSAINNVIVKHNSCLLYTSRKVIDWRVPATYLITLFVLAAGVGLMHGAPISYALFHLLTGGAMFGAVFMMTDPVTNPTSAADVYKRQISSCA